MKANRSKTIVTPNPSFRPNESKSLMKLSIPVKELMSLNESPTFKKHQIINKGGNMRRQKNSLSIFINNSSVIDHKTVNKPSFNHIKQQNKATKINKKPLKMKSKLILLDNEYPIKSSNQSPVRHLLDKMSQSPSPKPVKNIVNVADFKRSNKSQSFAKEESSNRIIKTSHPVSRIRKIANRVRDNTVKFPKLKIPIRDLEEKEAQKILSKSFADLKSLPIYRLSIENNVSMKLRKFKGRLK